MSGGVRRAKAALAARSERGSASIWLVGLAALLSMSVTVAVAFGAAVAAAGRASTGADFAALAGAAALVRHDSDPCAVADLVARANGVRLARCTVDGVDVRIWTAVSSPFLDSVGLSPGRARARAGPVVRPQQ